MTPENKVVFLKRSKSLLWRAGMMVAALVVDFALDNLGLFNMSEPVVVVLGLVLGELSKHISNVLKKNQ